MNFHKLSQKLFLNPSREDASIFFLGIIFLGFISDRGILSVGMIGLVAYVLLRSPWPQVFKELYDKKDLLCISLIFFIYALTGIYSENLPLLAERLRIKLPFLLLPWAFAQLKPFSKRQYTIILYLYLAFISLASFGVLLNYLLFFESITESFKYGKTIPTPYSHIRFSLFGVFAVFVGLELLRRGEILKYKWEKRLIVISTAFLFVFLHILAVRSGLLALYLALFFWILYYFISTKRYLVGSALMILLICIPWLSYMFIPSLNSKINYMLYDLKMGSSKQEYSDTGRLLSIKVGWELVKENIWFGVGSGDVRPQVISYYKQNYPDIKDDHNRKSPHNQFITTWLANGIFGLVLFCVFLFFPLFYKGNYKNLLIASFYIIIFSSLLTENTLEVQLGVAFFLSLLLPTLTYLRKE